MLVLMMGSVVIGGIIRKVGDTGGIIWVGIWLVHRRA